MELKQQLFIIKGMQRDLSLSKFSPEFAFENMNIRITAKEDNNLLSVTNEKGNIEANILDEDFEEFLIQGVYLGHGVLNNILILFTTELLLDITEDGNPSIDRIYRLQYNNSGDLFKGDVLYEGYLNFDVYHPIESLCIFENEDIQKIYWVDGKNQPRVANISYGFDNSKYIDTSFDFAQDLKLNEEIEVSRNLVSSGMFAPGVIQYAFSYYNQYAQETAIFHTSSLLYTSFQNRGGSPEDKVSNSFSISIENADTNFDYLRVYSIHRTTLDSTPTVKRVVDLNINLNGATISYIDNGISGDVVDPTELLFKGGDNIIAQTIEQKDNTLFLGNIKLNLNLISEEIVNSLRSLNTEFSQDDKDIKLPDPKGFYPYENTLKYNSDTIKTFKYLDWYRFGIQFQHKSGKWSEAIFLKDLQNTISIPSIFDYEGKVSQDLKQVFAKYRISNLNISRLVQLGFIKARGIVCYPDISDREVVAQGILAPTVFNTQDRYTNTPFAQSSWFVRPNAPFDKDELIYSNHEDLDVLGLQSLNSKIGFWESEGDEVHYDNELIVKLDTIVHGSLSEFRHFAPLPPNNRRNAEIQSNHDLDDYVLMDPFTKKTSSGDIAEYVGDHSDRFFVDQSIFTFHSPELEFDDSLKSMDSSNLKLRIVGMVPITSSVSDVDIITSTSTFNDQQPGFYKELIGSTNISRLGAKGLNSAVMWIDSLVQGGKYKGLEGILKELIEKIPTGFMIYPWHRNGSLNNSGVPKKNVDDIADPVRTAMLDKKKMSNMKYSYGSYYFKKDDMWNAYEEDNAEKTGLSGVEIFDSNEITLTKIPAPKNSNLDDINYYGNVDKIITSKKYPIIGVLPEDQILNAVLVGFGFKESYEKITNSKIFRSNLRSFSEKDNEDNDNFRGTEPIRMKYKSTAHAVMALNYTKDNKQRILPTIWDNSKKVNYRVGIDTNKGKPYWDQLFKGISQDVITSPKGSVYLDSIGYGYLWLAELYNDLIENRFGGTSKEAIENNLWVPCGEPISLLDNDGNTLKTAEIKYTEGDTFYGRYDCLKTYPSTLEDLNSVTDIVSFMVESRINLDGRYDRNRGQISNLAVSPTNFNLMNKVYSQPNNFFNYRSLNTDRFKLDDFRNSVVWSKGKTLGELTDTWSDINMISNLDLDGDKGLVNALSRFNNEIFAFQDKGVSRILFNSRVLVNASDGVPIEISNNYKVDGKVYISENIGCTNKWSLRNTKSGLYFCDDLNKSIYCYNGEGFNNVTDTLGFNSYFKDVSSLKKWNDLDFDNLITFYDNINDDIYFVNKNHALGYSEKIGLFTSFYDYGRVPLMFNMGDKTFALKDNKLWKQFGGEYNSFFGETKPYYITVIANQEPHLDKTYTNLNFRADTWDGKLLLDDVTFDKLDIWNEYQHGEQVLYMTKNRQSPLKKRFRIWNVLIPRDRVQKRDRIRNPWVYLKLAMNDPKDYKTELHDIIIDYFI